MPTLEDLRYFQSLPLDIKVAMTQTRLREWVNHYGVSGVYISFSGGKDSTVLLHIARQIYPDIKAVFVDTGLEFPEIRQFVKTFDNVEIVRPKKTFKQVICEYGYPMLSKAIAHNVSIARNKPDGNIANTVFAEKKTGRYAMHKWKPLTKVDFKISEKCCDNMKKKPTKKLDKSAITATMTCESKFREEKWLKNGCNAFDCKRPISNPMSFWTEQDVLQYIKDNDIKIASVYGDIIETDKNGQTTFKGCGKLCTTGCHRTGCIFCGFGAHLEKGEGRFERLKRTHPKLYDYCMGGGAYGEDGIWRPDNRGLGMAHVIDELCKLYGKDFIKY
jgi:3'-phosphoadenosine 5'-phosphosulfate sulfotransferase (PAPS reductase)/FAD synthetase